MEKRGHLYSDIFYTSYFLKVKVKVTQSNPTLCDSMDYIVHGILQARILEWVSLSLLQGIFPTGDRTQVSHITFLKEFQKTDKTDIQHCIGVKHVDLIHLYIMI